MDSPPTLGHPRLVRLSARTHTSHVHVKHVHMCMHMCMRMHMWYMHMRHASSELNVFALVRCASTRPADA